MTLANDSFQAAPDASGPLLATHLVGGKEYPVVMNAGPDGHVLASVPMWMLYQEPRVMTAAATDLFDLFNATGSGVVLEVQGLWLLHHFSAATAFTLPWRFDVIRTTAVGTGGTVNSVDAAAPTTGIVSLNKMDTANAALPAQVTARSVPTAGATAGTLLFPISMFFEEGSTVSNVGNVLGQFDNVIPQFDREQHLTLREGFGIKARQITATISTGLLVGWLMSFSVT